MASKEAPKKGPKRKRVVLTLKQKMEICRRLEQGENRNVLMKEFNIGSSTIYDIKSQSNNLKEFLGNSETEKSIENRHTLHSPKLEYLDRALYEWFTLKRSEGVSVSGPMLVGKAREFYEKMKLLEPCSFSSGWLSRFKARHGIRKLDLAGELKSTPDHQKTAEKFCEEFSKLVFENGLNAEHIYNADETALLWRCLPNIIFDGVNDTVTPRFKHNKDRLTVLICANAAGTHKVKLTVIGKYTKPRCLKGIPYLPVHYKSQTNAWMDSEIFVWWFHNVFVPSVKEHLRKKGMSDDDKIVLLLDNCRAHPPGHELVNGNIFVCFLPTNATTLIQPMIQGVVQKMKMFYRRDFLRKLTNYDGPIQDFQSKYNIKDAVFNLSCAWNSVNDVTLRRCWQKLWPRVMFQKGPEEDDEIQDCNAKTSKRTKDVFDDIVELVDCANDNNPVKRLSKLEISEWLEIDRDVPCSMILSPEEITDDVINYDNPKVVEEHDSGDDEEQNQEVTWKNAAVAFETLINFIERQSCFTVEDVINFHILHSTFLHKKRKACKQDDLRQLFNRTARFEVVSSPSTLSSLSDHSSSEISVLNFPTQRL